MPKEPIRAPLGVNVPGLPMAGFQLTLHGRIWVTPEVVVWVWENETVAGFNIDVVEHTDDGGLTLSPF
jgi:hypothetical protein